MSSQFLVSCALIFALFKHVSSSAVCPYSWQWNENKSLCIMNCDDYQYEESGKKNVNCLLTSLIGFNAKFDALLNRYTMSPAKSLVTPPKSALPSCYNVVLSRQQYNVTPNDQFLLNYNVLPIYRYNLEKVTNNKSVSVCYPLTPQLQQCDVTSTNPGDYKLENGTTLIIASKNISAYLGDFYINDDGVAYTCSQSVNVSLYSYPRCNYVKLKSDEYIINGDSSMFIYKANFTIKNPIYSFIIGEFTHVCIPLSISFLNCSYKLLWPPFNYVISHNLTVKIGLIDKSFTSDKYFFRANDLLVLCLDADNIEDARISSTVRTVDAGAYAVSALCLTIIFLVKIKPCKKNSHTKCFLCLISCLIVMYLTKTVHHLIHKLGTVNCYLLYTFYYYSNMSSFFWLNIIAYDSWRTFSNLQTSPYHCHCCVESFLNKNERNRFVVYNIYAWGMTLLLTITTFVVELTPMPRNIMFLNPQIINNCWFNTLDSVFAFYYIPLGILMLMNLIFFILTIHIIYNAGKGTDLVNNGRRRQMFKISVKLFIVMGLGWIMEIISFCLRRYESEKFKFWYISNAVTAAQGIAIFILYFATKNTLELFRNWLSVGCLGRNAHLDKDDELLHKTIEKSSSRSNSTKTIGSSVNVSTTKM